MKPFKKIGKFLQKAFKGVDISIDVQGADSVIDAVNELDDTLKKILSYQRRIIKKMDELDEKYDMDKSRW